MIGRPFIAPIIGFVLLFAALGPAVGGALFIPLSVIFEAPKGVSVMSVFGPTALILGHVGGWMFVYAFGLSPAAATGFLFALWDAASPARAPRAPVAALIGGLTAYGFLSRLNPVGQRLDILLMGIMSAIEMQLGAVEMKLGPHVDLGPAMARLTVTVAYAFVACGAITGLVCAFAANRIGLSMRLKFAPPAPVPPPSEGA